MRPSLKHPEAHLNSVLVITSAVKKEVDEVMGQARDAGANIIKPAQDTFWGGYAGYFQDPDGHLWEVVWNPAWENID